MHIYLKCLKESFLPVGSHDYSKPVERIGAIAGHDAEQGNLTADQKDEQSDRSPQEFFPKPDFPFWFLNFWQNTAEWLDQFQKFD